MTDSLPADFADCTRPERLIRLPAAQVDNFLLYYYKFVIETIAVYGYARGVRNKGRQACNKTKRTWFVQ